MSRLLLDAIVLVAVVIGVATVLMQGHVQLHRKFERQSNPIVFWLFFGFLSFFAVAKTWVIVNALL
jgi:hypothetical protein